MVSTRFVSKICFTGGAEGSDSVWENFALHYGWGVEVLSFETHRLYDKTKTKPTILTRKQLKEADPFLLRANKQLKRTFPPKSENVSNLLRRNYWQINRSYQILAVGFIDFEKHIVSGGTGWAVAMGVEIHLPITVWDISQKHWFEYDYGLGEFILCDVPHVEDVFTGIGTRKITVAGIAAIKNALETSRLPG